MKTVHQEISKIRDLTVTKFYVDGIEIAYAIDDTLSVDAVMVDGYEEEIAMLSEHYADVEMFAFI